jgi:hypothetical protein
MIMRDRRQGAQAKLLQRFASRGGLNSPWGVERASFHGLWTLTLAKMTDLIEKHSTGSESNCPAVYREAGG